MSDTIFADGIRNVSLFNGNVRIELTYVGTDGESHTAGTLVVPGNQAFRISNGLQSGLNELSERIKQQQNQADENAPS